MAAALIFFEAQRHRRKIVFMPDRVLLQDFTGLPDLLLEGDLMDGRTRPLAGPADVLDVRPPSLKTT